MYAAMLSVTSRDSQWLQWLADGCSHKRLFRTNMNLILTLGDKT